MSISQNDLDSFHAFATRELIAIGAVNSWEELLEKWRGRKEQADTIASIKRGIQDAEAGRARDLSAVDAEVRHQLGFPARGR